VIKYYIGCNKRMKHILSHILSVSIFCALKALHVTPVTIYISLHIFIHIYIYIHMWSQWYVPVYIYIYIYIYILVATSHPFCNYNAAVSRTDMHQPIRSGYYGTGCSSDFRCVQTRHIFIVYTLTKCGHESLQSYPLLVTWWCLVCTCTSCLCKLAHLISLYRRSSCR